MGKQADKNYMSKRKLILLFIVGLGVVATVGFTQGEQRELLLCLAHNQKEIAHYLVCKKDCDWAKQHRSKYQCMCDIEIKPCS